MIFQVESTDHKIIFCLLVYSEIFQKSSYYFLKFGPN